MPNHSTNYSDQITNLKFKKSWAFNHWWLFRLIRIIRLITIFIVFTIYYFLFAISATAQTMSSPNYKLKMPNLNFSSGAATSLDYKLGFTAGQTSPGIYTSIGYKVKAGFWYIKSIIPFTFTVSPTLIDFGVLTAGSPKTDTITLTVSAGGAGGYQVTVQEDKPLTSSAGNTIPDTTCDNGNCDEHIAGTWSQNSTYGFGYTMYGNDVPTPFPSIPPAGNQYKQFPDKSLNETPEPVMFSSMVGKNRSSTMTLKINISGTQAAGIYQNVLIFVATPTY